MAKRERLGHWIAVTSIGLYIAASLSLSWYVNDDAGITFTFARNLVDGRGLVFNIVDPPLEGYSNPLWLLLLSGSYAAGLNIVLASKCMGIAFGAISLVLIWLIVRREASISWVALPLCATNAAFIVWNNSGLENSLHGALLTGVAFLLARRAKLCRLGWSLGIALGLLVLSRPEGALFSFTVVAYFTVLGIRKRGVTRSAVFFACAIPLAVIIGLTVFRYAYFGDVLPNTYYAKAMDSNPLRVLNPFSGGWRYVGGAFGGAGWIVVFVPLMLLMLRPKTWPSAVPGILVLVGSQLFFVVSVGGDWMGEFRFISPIVPLFSILIGLALADLQHLLANRLSWGWYGAAACALAVGLILLTQLPRLIIFAHNPTTSLDVVGRIGRYFVDLARDAGIENPTLLHHDAGGTSYVARISVIDLGGLCDRTIARHWRDPERMRRYIFEEKRPTFIYSGPAFARKTGLESMPELSTDYVPLPPPPSPDLDGHIRMVRRDKAPAVLRAAANPALVGKYSVTGNWQ